MRKMMGKHEHVVPRANGKWAVKSEGSTKASKIFDKKYEAEDYGEMLAIKGRSCNKIHDKNSVIREVHCWH